MLKNTSYILRSQFSKFDEDSFAGTLHMYLDITISSLATSYAIVFVIYALERVGKSSLGD